MRKTLPWVLLAFVLIFRISTAFGSSCPEDQQLSETMFLELESVVVDGDAQKELSPYHLYEVSVSNSVSLRILDGVSHAIVFEAIGGASVAGPAAAATSTK